MNESTRRALALVGVLAFVVASFASGAYTIGQLSDRESTGASIQADGDFGGAAGNVQDSEVVTFSGCGEARLHLSAGGSFTAAFTVYNSSRGAREVVTLTDADAGSPASGFWYDSELGAYRFDVRAFSSSDATDRILGVRLDGEQFRNEHQCASTTGG